MKRREGQWKDVKRSPTNVHSSKGFSDLASWLSGKYHMECDETNIKETAGVCSCYVFIRCFHVNNDGHCESHLTNLHCRKCMIQNTSESDLHSYEATKVM